MDELTIDLHKESQLANVSYGMDMIGLRDVE